MTNLEDIWQKYKDTIRYYLYKKSINHEDVEDILQEVLIKSYKNINKIAEEKTIKAWLFKVVNTTTIDLLRKKSTKNIEYIDKIEYIEEEIKQDDSLAQCIIPFINKLPKEDCNLLINIEIKGKTQKEYASELGIPYSTLKSKVQKSRKKLQSLFTSCCNIELDRKGNIIDYNKKSSNTKC